MNLLGFQKPSDLNFDSDWNSDPEDCWQVESNLRCLCMRLLYSGSLTAGNSIAYSSPRRAPCWMLPTLCNQARPMKDDVILLALNPRYFIYLRATIANPSRQNRMEEKVNPEGSKAIRMPISEKIQRDLLKAKEELKTKDELKAKEELKTKVDKSNSEIIALKNKLQVKKQMRGKCHRIESLKMNGVRRLA
ncbi:hypothetical protein TNIN_350051 [Trichonephila inaurata madagascariensis]|uniref:Uncharacterized protein n=1 Tax=Trichonephila inaurata madagascariensis TaxID=2747483 RepID=A0A8X6JQP5_9ARAC|nr:hypothetical protein TNIN_350051 [Trichonephila inaurata madagascariensis]